MQYFTSSGSSSEVDTEGALRERAKVTARWMHYAAADKHTDKGCSELVPERVAKACVFYRMTGSSHSFPVGADISWWFQAHAFFLSFEPLTHKTASSTAQQSVATASDLKLSRKAGEKIGDRLAFSAIRHSPFLSLQDREHFARSGQRHPWHEP